MDGPKPETVILQLQEGAALPQDMVDQEVSQPTALGNLIENKYEQEVQEPPRSNHKNKFSQCYSM